MRFIVLQFGVYDPLFLMADSCEVNGKHFIFVRLDKFSFFKVGVKQRMNSDVSVPVSTCEMLAVV